MDLMCYRSRFEFPALSSEKKILFRSINTEILQWQVVSFSGQDYGFMLVSSFNEPEPLLRPLFLVFMELFDFISDLLNEK